MNNQIFNESMSILKELYGEYANFREGQYEAIEATLTNKRTLVVQKTGWGKSLVYFIATKLNRRKGNGVTLIISPLLVLMENQIEAANKLGLNCGVLNSTIKGKEAREEIITNLVQNQYDLFFITPESLFKAEVQNIIGGLEIGLFVIDECHCISDWGHDFRLDYSNLYKIIELLPRNVSVLGTTATANDRVVNDLKQQFGDQVFVSRGPLTRQSLHIEILKLESAASRYAWMKKNIPILPGSGIIYCLTRRDCENLTNYLTENGIEAMPYYSDAMRDEQNSIAEKRLMENKIKVLVATVKLGMGYDKPDISFIIHYQQPGSVVSYYQQIGRAGRSIPNAYCYLMTGQEDDSILNYFIENAFPTEEQAQIIVRTLEKNDGLTIAELEQYCNLKRSKVSQFLTFLENEGYVYKERSKYYRSATAYSYNGNHYDQIKQMKYHEKALMKDYIQTQECLSKYVVNALDDLDATHCGKCYNCTGNYIINWLLPPTAEEIHDVQMYLNSRYLKIDPRKKWPSYVAGPDGKNKIELSHQNEIGIVLGKYGDSGYGKMVVHDKYQADKYSEELIEKSVSILKNQINQLAITAITNVPSCRSKKVDHFALEVANRLGLQYLDLFEKLKSPQQKEMENSFHQAKNALNSIKLKSNIPISENVILIDDIVDSRWTLTVCGWFLKNSGANVVFPFCLADSSELGGYS